MEEQTCPKCRTSKYTNPSLKFLVNVCGHSLCDSCVELLFMTGSGSCPQCGIPLRRTNFRVQVFEDPIVEKDVDIRKRVLRDFNKKEEDFESIKDYNDYLEEVETIIYNLSHNIDVAEMNKKIEQFKRENKETIVKNKSKLGRDEYEIEELLEIEKHHDELRKRKIEVEETEAKKKKIREKEALIDELMFSTGNAKEIVDTFKSAAAAQQEEDDKRNLLATSQFSTGVKFQSQRHTGFLPIPKIDEGPLFTYKPILLDISGPRPPDLNEIDTNKYVSNIRAETLAEIAGGFKASTACYRALIEAFTGLYYVPPVAKKIILDRN